MANFNTHVTVTAVATGAAAIALQALGFLDMKGMIVCWMLGILGGILPDIDSDDKKALGLIFNIITGCLWIILTVALIKRISLLEFAIIFILATALVRGGLYELMRRTTSHRGIFHSVVAGLAFTFLAAAVAGRLVDGFVAWVMASFLLFGYLLHLLLDEIYRVNLVGDELEKPLFSSFKVISLGHKAGAAGLVLVTAILWLFTPRHQPLVEKYNQQSASNTSEYSSKLGNRFWPEDNKLFGIALPNLDDYIEYDVDVELEVKVNEKGETVQEKVESTKSQLGEYWEKITEFWHKSLEEISQLRAEPSDDREST